MLLTTHKKRTNFTSETCSTFTVKWIDWRNWWCNTCSPIQTWNRSTRTIWKVNESSVNTDTYWLAEVEYGKKTNPPPTMSTSQNEAARSKSYQTYKGFKRPPVRGLLPHCGKSAVIQWYLPAKYYLRKTNRIILTLHRDLTRK